jgi:hypothetical protein
MRESVTPLRPLRILIEDPTLVTQAPNHSMAVDITTCSGPRDDRDTCPLVMDGRCPLGPFDVVVTALRGPWARCVRAAWAETNTPLIDAGGLATPDPDERFAHHVGAALQGLWEPWAPVAEGAP